MERSKSLSIKAVKSIVLMMFYWFPNLKKFLNQIKEVAYDKENLYVKEGDYEIQIPFYEVKDIEILSLDGCISSNFIIMINLGMR